MKPRHYADHINSLPTPQERREAIENVPEWCREWVKEYVRSYINRRKHGCIKIREEIEAGDGCNAVIPGESAKSAFKSHRVIHKKP